VRVRRRELGLEVFNWGEVYDLRALPKTEIYNDFSRPYGLLDATAIVIDVEPGKAPAGLFVYRNREQSPLFGTQGIGLLRLLLPAFRAGVESCRSAFRLREQLSHHVDRLSDGVMLIYARGDVLHDNTVLSDMLAADPESGRLRQELVRIAMVVAAQCEHRGVRHKRRDSVQHHPGR